MILNKCEYNKAGELLWGSIAEAAKALYLKYTGRPINNHNKIRSALDELCLQYNDIGFSRDWNKAADRFHVNFYETFMEKDEFLETYENGKLLLTFIQSLTSKPFHVIGE